MAHNPIVKGDLVYVSYYMDGLWIYDISNPGNTTVAGYYDLYVGAGDTISSGGAWGVYPFLPSGNILVSDMGSGLFVFDASAAETVIATLQQPNTGMTVTPNPVVDGLNLRFDNRVEVLNMRIIDMAGKVVYYSAQECSDQNITYPIPVLRPGQYIVHVTTAQGSIVQTITKAVSNESR
jgi:hypothetical protein